ncbi:MAG TPA: LLM class flavin-dependent oxidoreductase, partial [Candidatus Limnocylindrales bacterium]
HRAYGRPYPDVAERVARLEEAVAVLRALWTGGPVTRPGAFYPLVDADALPVPAPPPPIVIGGQTRTGARIAARIADGWTCRPEDLDRLLPVFTDALATAGRSRDDVRVVVGWENGRSGEDALAGSPWIDAPGEEAARWRAAGADGVVLLARTEADVAALVDAAARR